MDLAKGECGIMIIVAIGHDNEVIDNDTADKDFHEEGINSIFYLLWIKL